MTMTCRQATCLLTDVREGKLSGWTRLRYRLHLTMCPACRAYVRGFDQMLVALSALPREAPPAALCDTLRGRLRQRAALRKDE
jgi:predicted anti-sigma-YlaC factor YlaD